MVQIHSPRPKYSREKAGFLREFGLSCFWQVGGDGSRWAVVGVDKQDLDRNPGMSRRSSQTSSGTGSLPATYAAESILSKLDENETLVSVYRRTA